MGIPTVQQGSILTDTDACKLGLVGSPNSGKCAIVISHDCDLANYTAEEYIECIIGELIDKPDPGRMSACHPRCLHLHFDLGGESLYVELSHGSKQCIKKDQFSNVIQASIITQDEKRILKQWLAARYGRPAFPDSFEKRLRIKVKKNETVEKSIAEIAEPAAKYLIGLFFDLGSDRFVELDDESPYFLSIAVVYDAVKGGTAARESAEMVASKLKKLFNQVYGSVDSKAKIVLENCNAIADTMFSLADLRKVDQWRLEYISLREDSISPLIPTGSVAYA